MKKFEKKQLIVIILSVIIGIIAVTAVNLNSSAVKIAFSEPQPTKEDYNILKEYALKVAKGEDFNKNEELEINKEIQNGMLKIRISIPNMYGIEASFPLSEEKILEIENGTIEYKGIISYDNAIYSEYKTMESKINFIFMDLIMIIAIAVLPYMLFYWAPKEWKEIDKKIAK